MIKWFKRLFKRKEKFSFTPYYDYMLTYKDEYYKELLSRINNDN